MKKKIVFSIAFVALALTFVLFGVFALKNKNLNTVGTVGFTTHECEVSVYGEFQNVATSASSGTLETVTFFSQENPYKITENNSLEFNETILKDSNGDSVSAIYFCRVGEEANSITFLMSMKNNSFFDVSVDLTSVSFGENTLIERTVVPAFIKQGETQTLNLTLFMIDTELEAEENFEISMSFAKADDVSDLEEPNVTKYSYQSFIYTLNEDSTANIVGYSKNANVTDLEIPQVINGHTVVSIGERAFYGNTVIETLVIPKTVTEIGVEAFSLCTNLTSVTFDDGTEVPVEGVSPFANTYSLENGNGLKIIRSGAFSYCTSLVNLIIPKNVEVIENGAFSSCQSLEAFVVEEGNTYFTVEEGVLYTSDLARLLCYPAGKTDETFRIPANIFDIDSSAFDNCLYLLKLIAKENTGVNPDDFDRCLHSYVETVVEPTCTEMGYTHYRCTRCGFEYSNKFVHAKGHHFYNHTCLICGVDEIFENIEADTEWYTNGQSPYTITTKEELAGLSYLVYTGINFSGKTVLLGNDISIEDYEWVPIGNSTTAFAGTFDGQNYTISNLKINTNTGNVGLFGYVTGIIKNFNVTQANIIIDGEVSNVGIAVGYVNNVLSGISVSGNLTAPSGTNVGGVAGYVRVSGNTTHTNLSSSATVTGLTRVGGIIGNFYSDVYRAVVTASFDTLTNSGKVTAIGNQVGGIGGYFYVEDTSYDQHRIVATNLNNTGDIEGQYDVAGIVGFIFADNYGERSSLISNSSSSSKIKAVACAGAFFGYNHTISLDNCSNEGTTIEASGYWLENKSANVGGYFGSGAYTNISNCTNYAEINYKSEGIYVGGIAGYIEYGYSFTNVYNTAKISSPNMYTGGLVGYISIPGQYSYTSLGNTGDITGLGEYTGGLFGRIYREVYRVTLKITMKDLSNSGNITGSISIGGIAGSIHLTDTSYDATSIDATNLINTGDITGEVENSYYIGGLFGYANFDTYSPIKDSSNSGTITALARVGGLVGYSHRVSYLNCSNEGTTLNATGYFLDGTTKYADVGGYVGWSIWADFVDCTNKVTINYTSEGTRIGGITGYGNALQTLTNVSNEAEISSPNMYVGGLVGYADVHAVYTYTNISNTADITGDQFTGGLFGRIYMSVYRVTLRVTINGASNSGKIVGKSDTGGLMGSFHLTDTSYNDTSLQATNLINTGNVTGEYNIGGLFGWLGGDTSSRIYDSSNSGTITGIAKIGGFCGYMTIVDIINGTNEGTIINATGYFEESSVRYAYVGGYVGCAVTATYNSMTNYAEINYQSEGIYVGGIAGYTSDYYGGSNLSNIKNINTNSKYVGGLYGYLSTSSGSLSTYENLTNNASITGTYHVGGLFGWASAGALISLKNSSSQGTITAISYVGGFAGYSSNISLNACSNEGTTIVTSGYYEDGANKHALVGGYFGNGNAFDLTDITNYVEIDYACEAMYVGGIAGYATNIYTLTNVSNPKNITAENSRYVGGLFGYATVNGARTFTNLTNNANITGTYNVGGLFGYANASGASTLTESSSQGTITAIAYVGGLFGYDNYISLTSCSNEGTTIVTSGYYLDGSNKQAFVGGYIGNANQVNLTDITNNIEITFEFEGNYVGGITGYGSNNTAMTNVNNSGKITAPLANHVGGLVGYLTVNGARTFEELHNTGDVIANYIVGGLFGYAYASGSSYVKNSSNNSDIIAEAYVGGLYGYGRYMSPNGCSNEGTTITANSFYLEGTTKQAFIGGFIGYSVDYDVMNCINKVEINYTGEGNYVGGIIGYGAGTWTVNNLSNEADIITNSSYVGGLFGNLNASGTVTHENLTNSGSVVGINYVGGIYGRIYDGVYRADCYLKMATINNAGSVTATGDYVGGLCGYMYLEDTSYDQFDLQANEVHNTGDVTGRYLVGGLFGYALGDAVGTIKDSTVNCNIIAESYVGGLFGYNHAIYITNCSNEGSTITANSYYLDGTTRCAYIGGYVGAGHAICFNDLTNYIEINYTGEGDCVGGIGGYITSYRTSTNLTNIKTITTNSVNYTGGIIGHARTDGTNVYTNITNTANITGVNQVAGLYGYLYAGVYRADCYINMNIANNSGNITGSGDRVGAICGRMYLEDTSYDQFDLRATELHNTGDITGRYIVGGLFGDSFADTVGLIKDSSVNCNIVAEGYVGGLFGYNHATYITNCSNEGTTITVNSCYLDGSTKYAYIGGYVGNGHALCFNDLTNYIEINYTGEGIYVGGIGGYITSYRTSTNLTNLKAITANSNYVGGIIGHARTDGTNTYTNINNNADITGLAYVAGLYGYLYAGVYRADCCIYMNVANNTGNINATGDFVGGICGEMYLEDTSYDQFDLQASELHNTGDIVGNCRIGGLFGCAFGDAAGKISDSSSSANITAVAYIGGLLGWNHRISLVNCSNEGTKINSSGYYIESSKNNAFIGGYIGKGYDLSLTDVSNAVEINYEYEGIYVGGLIGYIEHVGLTRVTNTANVTSASNYVGGIIGCANPLRTVTDVSNTGNITGAFGYVGGIAGHGTGMYNQTNVSNTGVISGTEDYVAGLVGYAGIDSGRTLTNLTNDANITGRNCVGGIYGYVNSGSASTMLESSSKGTITGNSLIGGFFGQVYRISLNNCTNEGTEIVITGHYLDGTNKYAYAGGYIGWMYDLSLTDITNNVEINYTGEGARLGGIVGYAEHLSLTRVTNNANVTSTASYVGGIIGQANPLRTVTDVSNTGNITSAFGYVGGIAGYATGMYNQTNVSNTGTITGTESYVAGLVGYAGIDSGRTLTNLTNQANITGYNYVAGLYGYVNSGSASTIKDSASSGTITANAYTGGLFGHNIRISLVNCSNEGTTLVVSGIYEEGTTKYAFFGGYIGRSYDLSLTDITNNAEIIYENVGIYVGGVVGFAEYLQNVVRVTNNANVTSGGQFVGGIVGRCEHFRTVTDVTNTGDITGAFGYVGGIAGRAVEMYNQTNVSNTGVISGTEDYVGGLVGYAHINSARTLTNLTNTANVTGRNYIAGIYGYIDSAGASTIKDSASSGTITANAYTGGFFGKVYRLSLVNCSNDGTTIVASGYFEEGTNKYAFFGGYIGWSYDLSITDVINNVEINYENVGIYVGGIVGYAEYLQNVVRVTNTANITSGGQYVGGIVGRCEHFRTVTDVTNTGNITGAFGYVGGIAGRAVEMYNQTNVSNTGVISGTEDYVGGLVGYATINSARTLTNLTNESNVTGRYYVGGLFGFADAGSLSTLIDSASQGTITAVAYVGGLFGHNSDINLTNCSNEDTVIVTSGYFESGANKFAYVGGYVGYGNAFNLTDITNNVEITYEYEGMYVGGIIGYATNLYVFTNIHNTANITASLSNNVGGIVGYTTISGARTLTNVTNTANITGQYIVGGLFGYANASGASNLTESSSQGTITAIAYVGGLFAYNNNISLTGCSNEGTTIVTSGYYLDGTNKQAFVGGYIGNANQINLTDITNNIEISYESEGNYVGGIIGYATNLYVLTNVQNTANVVAETINYVGGIAGYVTISGARTLMQIVNTGNITGQYIVGGLFGHYYSGSVSTITNSNSNANITAEAYVGGLIGYAYGITLNICSNEGSTLVANTFYLDGTNKYAYLGGYIGNGHAITVIDCTNTVELNYTGEGDCVGGIAGFISSIRNFTNVENVANITSTSPNYVGGLVGNATTDGTYTLNTVSNSGNISGNNYVGGLFGRYYAYVAANHAITITASSNSGNITATGNYVGGIAGYFNAEESGNNRYEIYATEIHNTGDVEGIYIVGGLFGHFYSDTAASYIKDSTSSGNIKAVAYVGGLMGYNHAINLTNCSNEGTTIETTGYYESGNNKYAYLGGIVGNGHALAVTGCNNYVEINYTGEGDCVGGIAGFISSTRNFTNVSNVANITSTSPNYVGGLVGNATSDGSYTFSGLSNSANIIGNNYTGGLFGRFYANINANNNFVINTSINSGKITATGNYVGGIAGYFAADESGENRYDIQATEIHNTGDIEGHCIVGGLFGHLSSDHSTASYIKNSTSSGKIKAFAYVGGLIGYNLHMHMTNCSNEGTTVIASGFYISGTTQYAYVGGLVGAADNLTITDCANYANIEYLLEYNYVGGIAGNIAGCRALTNVSNYGNITANLSSYVGGLIGNATAAGEYTLTKLTNSGEIEGINYVGGLFGRYYANSSTNYGLKISEFNNSGKVIATGDYVGGLAGYFGAEQSGNDYYEIVATELFNTGDIEGQYIVGGLFGQFLTDHATAGSVTNTSNNANIKAVAYVGGLFGNNTKMNISGAVNEGTITVTGYYPSGENKYAYVGGIVGYATTINIVSCENKATINCSDEGNYVGGIVGYGTTIYNFNTNTNTGKITASKANYVGGIAGNVAINGARTLTTLINNGEIVGKDYVGGIGGYLTASAASTMTTSSNTASITGEMRVGGLFGYNSLISLSDCTNDGDILSATAYVGGLIGQLSNITIDNSINNGNIEINKYYFDQTNKLAYVGGLVGYADKVTITDSSNNGAIDNKADGLYVGGVIGYANNLYTLTNLTNTGAITSVSSYVGGILGYAVVSGARTFETLTNTGSVSGKYAVGGIAGYITASTASTIITSSNSSSVTANAIVGGLFGYDYGVNVNDCENTDSVVTATNYYLDGVIKYAYLGGFVGYGNAISISDCENVATLNYSSEGARVGGIAGYISNSKALTNLTNSANITAITADCVGGIIGEINTNASVTYTNLTNTVAVSGLNSVGGIIGRVDCIDKNVTFTLTMTLFTNSGEITSTGNYVAGVVGYFNLSDANNKTPVLAGTELNNSGNVTGFNNVAGVFGFANAKGASSISSSENTGVITATILEGEQAEEAVFGDLVAISTNVEFVA